MTQSDVSTAVMRLDLKHSDAVVLKEKEKNSPIRAHPHQHIQEKKANKAHKLGGDILVLRSGKVDHESQRAR